MSARRRNDSPVRASSIVGQVLGGIPTPPPPTVAPFARILALWPTILNPQWAKGTQPQGIKNGVLRVACASGGMVQNLRLEARALVDLIRERVPEAHVMQVVPYFGHPTGFASWDSLRGTNAREPEQPLLQQTLEPVNIQERIARARAKQKAWADHMKSNGWRGCPICRTVPVMGTRPCAMCEHKAKMRRKYARNAA